MPSAVQAEPAAVRAPNPAPRLAVGQVIGRLDSVLVAVTIGGAILRLWAFGSQSLWFDEWLTVDTASLELSDVVADVGNRQGMPPTYFLVMWGWTRLVGDGEAALRAMSVLAGIATIPVAYAIARALGQRRVAARVAALVVAANPMLVWYSQEARPYSLLALLGALTVLAFVRARSGDRRDILVWGLVCAVALMVHYFAVFIVAAELGGLLLVRRQQWRRLLVACLPVVLVLAVLTPLAVDQHSHGPDAGWISEFPLADRVSEAGRSALTGPTPPHGRLWIVAAAVTAVAAVLLVTRASTRDRSAAALVAGVAAASVLMPLAGTVVGVDVFLSRYVIAALVPVLVALAIGLATRRNGWVGGSALVVLCAVWLTIIVADARDPDLQRADWRSVAEVFEEGSGRRALVMNVYGNLGSPLQYYVDDSRVLGEGETARVDEIDILVGKSTTKPCNFFVGQACALVFLGAPLPAPLAGEFTLDARFELDQFIVERYRSDSPVSVTRSELIAPADPGGALVLLV